MDNRGILYRQIADAYADKKHSFTQLELSISTGISLSTVNSAVTELKEIGAVRLEKRSFSVIAPKSRSSTGPPTGS